MPLRTQFGGDSTYELSPPPWIELRLLARDRFVLEAVPNQPLAINGALDLAALQALRKDMHPWNPIDVLVAPEIDTQQLVDTIVALDQSGVRTIGLGHLPSEQAMAKRGKPIPSFRVDVAVAEGTLDREELSDFRRWLQASAALRKCYDTALATNGALAGIVTSNATLGPNGVLLEVSGSGLDPALARCMTTELRKTTLRAAATGQPKLTITFKLAPSQRTRRTSRHGQL